MTDVWWSMSIITASVAPDCLFFFRFGFYVTIAKWIDKLISKLNKSTEKMTTKKNKNFNRTNTHPMLLKCQPPKILHRIALVKIVNRPYVRQINPVMDPTSWCNLVFASDLQRICHQRLNSMHNRMVLGTKPSQTYKLPQPYRLYNHRQPKLLQII